MRVQTERQPWLVVRAGEPQAEFGAEGEDQDAGRGPGQGAPALDSDEQVRDQHAERAEGGQQQRQDRGVVDGLVQRRAPIAVTVPITWFTAGSATASTTAGQSPASRVRPASGSQDANS